MPKTSPERLAYAKKYREEHKEEIAAFQKEYREKNKDELKKSKKEYSDAHKKEKSEYDKKRAQLPAKYETYYEKFLPYYGEENLQRDPKNAELIQVRCKYCNKWFNPTNRQAHDRYVSITMGKCGDRELYCSSACKNACPIYRQQKFPKGFQENSSREVQPELRKMVFERDNWTCQKCGRSKEEFPKIVLHCHHIFPLNEDPIGSADLDNCETLCKECHQWKHMNIPGCSYNELQCNELL